MQVIENLKIKEKLYVEKMKNGLTVMIIPKENIQKKYVIWGTNFGSIDNKFIIPNENKQIEVPDGVAHFLEHKLFEQENGKNSLDVLTGLGADANAYTTNDHTAYLFETVDNFYEILDEFMNYVQKPYFTDENVEKEKGIIAQEIMMENDHPGWKVYLNALECMYVNNPIKLEIAGSVESIQKIDKEVLYNSYNVFYNPSNMVLVLCGDFKPEKIIKEVEKRLVDKEAQGEIRRIYPEEPEKINKKIIETNMEVSMPIFVIGIKDKPNNGECVKKHIAIEIILNMLLGASSKLYKRMYENGNLIYKPELDYDFSKTYAHITISGQSKNPKILLEEVKKELNNMKKQGIDDEYFNIIKRKIYGAYISDYNYIGNIARMFLTDYFKGINSFEYLENYSTIEKKYVMQILNEIFREDNMILSVINPNN